ncbi:hypothetical protein [Vitreimonas flagellata]|uniref:hypothetical protein n=1 Tax=Vitreimonas flagellata TaxID=2560861 RepID=UPI001074FA42|nr:hypothetical protein [Vitreimonas flagellata]
MGKFIRQFHRWVSAFFVLSVIATTIALTQAEPIMWMSYVPLFPLALLALSGIYLFVQPYLPKRRTGA